MRSRKKVVYAVLWRTGRAWVFKKKAANELAAEYGGTVYPVEVPNLIEDAVEDHMRRWFAMERPKKRREL